MPKREWHTREDLGERSVTLSVKDLSRIKDESQPGDVERLARERPRTRGDCKDAARPCVYVGCTHNLYLDCNEETGSVKFNYPDLEAWEMGESCSLDLADRGGMTREQVGDAIPCTRERVRQIEVRALVKLKMLGVL